MSEAIVEDAPLELAPAPDTTPETTPIVETVEKLPEPTQKLEELALDDPLIAQAVASDRAKTAEKEEESVNDASKKQKSKQQSSTSAGESKRRAWPPPDWVDTFKRSPNASYRFVNQLTSKLTRVSTRRPNEPAAPPPNSLEEAYQDIGLLFMSDVALARKFTSKTVKHNEWGCHEIPDMRGPCKKIWIHTTTLNLFGAFQRHYGVCGLEFHKVPHPKVEGVWVISEIYLYSGNEIAAELKSDYRCTNCGAKNAQRVCDCDTARFCSLYCKDQALMNGRHMPYDCDEALGKTLVTRSIVAKKRMIAMKEALERDESLGKQITVVSQNKMQEASRTAEQEKLTADAYFKAKRAKLEASSAATRAALGMSIDPNIAPELQVGGEQHLAAIETPLPELPKKGKEEEKEKEK